MFNNNLLRLLRTFNKFTVVYDSVFNTKAFFNNVFCIRLKQLCLYLCVVAYISINQCNMGKHY